MLLLWLDVVISEGTIYSDQGVLNEAFETVKCPVYEDIFRKVERLLAHVMRIYGDCDCVCVCILTSQEMSRASTSPSRETFSGAPVGAVRGREERGDMGGGGGA